MSLFLFVALLTTGSALAQTRTTTTAAPPATTTTTGAATTGAPTTTTPAPTYSYCHGMSRQSCQSANGCYWCPIFGQGNNGTCHEVGPYNGAAPSGSFFCPYCQNLAQAVGLTCLQLDDYRCKYCYSNQQCMVIAAQGCPSCGNAQSSTQCAAYGSAKLPSCQWCAITTTCYNPVNYQSDCHCSTLQHDLCLQFPQQCQYCSLMNVCQAANRPCETCATTYNMYTCQDTDVCSWCSVTGECYRTTGNYTCPLACGSITDVVQCNEASTCNYCALLGQCLSSYQICESCGSITGEYDCTQATACSWCAFTQSCQLPSALCPWSCGELTAQYQCSSAPSCSYCATASTCQVASAYCAPCSSLTSSTDCSSTSGCDWCWFTSQCLSSSTASYMCPSTCSGATTQIACNGAATMCSWCYSDGSYSSGTGSEQCFDVGYCSSTNFGGLGLGGLIGVVIGSVVLCACCTTCCCVWRRRRRAAMTATTVGAGGRFTSPSYVTAPLINQPAVGEVAAPPPVYGSAAYTTAAAASSAAAAATVDDGAPTSSAMHHGSSSA